MDRQISDLLCQKSIGSVMPAGAESFQWHHLSQSWFGYTKIYSVTCTLISVLTKAAGFLVASAAAHLHPGGFISLVQTRHQRENHLTPESVGALTVLLDQKLMLSALQPLFYTSCQRATHEYVCQRGRSHNLCKVSSCIMQPIYASPGCDCAQESTHRHTHKHTSE